MSYEKKKKALAKNIFRSEKPEKGLRYTKHQVGKRETSHEYPEIRSMLKHEFGKKSSKVRQLLHNLKPNTSEAIPSKYGYMGRAK